MKTYLDTAARAARGAGKLQKERLWSEHEIQFKGEINLVTEVDRACEELIVANAMEGSFAGLDFEVDTVDRLHSPRLAL